MMKMEWIKLLCNLFNSQFKFYILVEMQSIVRSVKSILFLTIADLDLETHNLKGLHVRYKLWYFLFGVSVTLLQWCIRSFVKWHGWNEGDFSLGLLTWGHMHKGRALFILLFLDLWDDENKVTCVPPNKHCTQRNKS